MTNAQRNTSQPANPAAALWRIAVSEYETAAAKSAAFEPEHNALAEAWFKDKAKHDAAFIISEAQSDALYDALSAARSKVFATPAPDAAALLQKLDLLVSYLTEVQGEDVERVVEIQTDVRRLFGGK